MWKQLGRHHYPVRQGGHYYTTHYKEYATSLKNVFLLVQYLLDFSFHIVLLL